MSLKFAKHPPQIHLSNLVSLTESLAVKVKTDKDKYNLRNIST